MAAANNASSAKKVDKTKTSQKGFFSLVKELKLEFKRITWASKEQVKKSTVVVMIFCIMYMIYVGLLDFGFKNLFQLIFK